MDPMLRAARQRVPAVVEATLRLVSVESPSNDRAALCAGAAEVAALGAGLLGTSPRITVVDGIQHLVWQLGDGPGRVLLLGHYDTVWPVGTLQRLPATHQNGVIRGPGCFDMKAGLAMAMHAVALARKGAPVTVLVNGDEETGSSTSRRLIEETARRCDSVLVLEGAAEGGALKVARKGVSHFRVGCRVGQPTQGSSPTTATTRQLPSPTTSSPSLTLRTRRKGRLWSRPSSRLGTTLNTVPATGVGGGRFTSVDPHGAGPCRRSALMSLFRSSPERPCDARSSRPGPPWRDLPQPTCLRER